MFGIVVLLSVLSLPLQFKDVLCTSEVKSKMSGSDLDPKVETLSNEIHDWISQPEQNFSNLPVHLKELVDSINAAGNGSEIFSGAVPLCEPCNLLASVFVYNIRVLNSVDVIFNFLTILCTHLVYRQDVCTGLILQDINTLCYIVRNTDIDGPTFCSLALGGNLGCGPFKGPSWTLDLPFPSKKKKKKNKSHKYSEIKSQYESKEGKADKKVLKVLHLTDIHIDPNYKQGTNAVCRAPLCCNEDSGEIEKPSDCSGKWGDYRGCDSPKWLIENMLRHIWDNHKDIDYIMCSGDIIQHNTWKRDQETIEKQIIENSNLLLKYFPNTLIYGAVGNHESNPRDSFAPPEIPGVFSVFGNQRMYDVVVTNWERLQRRSLDQGARFAGHYSVLIRPGFKLISINTNFCLIFNWWILFKPEDPGNVLKWLINELQVAESNNELVHILGHIPPLYENCYEQWSHEYSRIVSRYSNIIRGQFFGHSHADEFRVHYDVNNARIPVGVEYLTPSNGPYINFNPSYRLYYIDGDHPNTTRNVLDHETYYMNLTQANTLDDPQWNKLYSAREDLELKDLSPSSWDNLVKRMAKDPELFSKFYRYYIKESDPGLEKGCDKKCRRKLSCALVEGDSFLPPKCGKCCKKDLKSLKWTK